MQLSVNIFNYFIHIKILEIFILIYNLFFLVRISRTSSIDKN